MLNPDAIVKRLRAILPGQESLTLVSLGDAGGASTSTTWNAQRKPANQDMLIAVQLLGVGETCNFEAFKETQDVEPRVGDQWTDGDDETWTIKGINVKLVRRVFDCLCLKDL